MTTLDSRDAIDSRDLGSYSFASKAKAVGYERQQTTWELNTSIEY